MQRPTQDKRRTSWALLSRTGSQRGGERNLCTLFNMSYKGLQTTLHAGGERKKARNLFGPGESVTGRFSAQGVKGGMVRGTDQRSER